MRLGGVQAKDFGSEIEISANIGDKRLWYRVPSSFAGEVRAEAFVIAGLMSAMAKGESLEVSPELRISRRLLGSLPTIQHILHAWIPALQIINVRANCGLPAPPRPDAACFFSGGVDSAYTYLKHADEISHLILIHGLDMHHDDQDSFARALGRGSEVADNLGKTIVPVRTNAREFCKASGLTMILFHGALLASVSVLLGFQRNYIPASQTYNDLEPWGSHPLLDPLWSTEACEIIYDGAEARRIDKVRVVAEHPDMLASLRVCPGHGAGGNCGQCDKCLLTMIALRLVRAQTSAFPKLDVRQTKNLLVNLDNLEFYLEMYEVAQEVGDAEIEKRLRSCLRRFEMKQLAKRADAVFLGGMVRRLVGGFRGTPSKSALLRPEDPAHTTHSDTAAIRLWRTKALR